MNAVACSTLALSVGTPDHRRPDILAPPIHTRHWSERRLWILKVRLQLFLYRHPVEGILRIIDVIDNAETSGEVQLLLDYILGLRIGAMQTRPWALPVPTPIG